MSKRKKTKRDEGEWTEGEGIAWNKGDPAKGEVVKVYYYSGRETLTLRFKAFYGNPPLAGGWLMLNAGLVHYSDHVTPSKVGYMFAPMDEVASKLKGLWNIEEVEILADHLEVKLSRPYDDNEWGTFDAPI